ncbi:MAG: hypothetical protein ACE5HB_08695 [Terriglobia bacterium]
MRGVKRVGGSGLRRTSQIVYGERQSLDQVLRLLRRTRMPPDRRRIEEHLLRELIRLRTHELRRINPDWERQIRLASNRRTSAATLRRVARRLAPDDYYLARLVSDHANAPADVLKKLSRHAYSSVRENVARHPRTPVATLRALARDRREPLWYLVAFNPSTPTTLREQLRARMQRRKKRR